MLEDRFFNISLYPYIQRIPVDFEFIKHLTNKVQDVGFESFISLGIIIQIIVALKYSSR